jgi:hypothetical protein
MVNSLDHHRLLCEISYTICGNRFLNISAMPEENLAKPGEAG